MTVRNMAAVRTRIGEMTVSESEFVDGAPKCYDDPERTTFAFSEDTWWPLDRLGPGQAKSSAKIEFGLLPPWLREEAKLYVAHLWLRRGKSMGTMRTAMATFWHLHTALGEGEEPFEGSIMALDRHQARRFALYITRRFDVGRQALAQVEGPRSQRVVRRVLAEVGGFAPVTARNTTTSINGFASWLRSRRGVDTDFQVKLDSRVWRSVNQVASADEHKVLDETVLKAILDAVAADVKAFRQAKVEHQKYANTPRSGHKVRNGTEFGRRRKEAWQRYWKCLNNAIKGQALQLQLATARRRGAVVCLPLEPHVKTLDVEGEKSVVNVLVPAFKLHGDQGAEEWVPCPGLFGDLALDAIRTAQELTAEFRDLASPDVRGLLFITLGQSNRPVALEGKFLQQYLNSDWRWTPGIVQRYGIKGGEHVTTHYFRHTNATRIVENGGSVLLAARYLGHVVTNLNPLMARLFYVAGGTEGMRNRTVRELEHGAAQGLRFDAVARVATHAAGPEAEAADVPPNQLPFEEAIRRIRRDNIVEDLPNDEEMVDALLQSGMVINLTRYGGCILQATSGPCPTSEKCPIGLYPEAPETHAGRGCPHQVLMPHALNALQEDIALMEVQLELYRKDPSYAFWLKRLERKLAIWSVQVARAEAMRERMAVAGEAEHA